MMALNDVWALDVSNWSKLKWEKIETVGARPTPRGYHTANLIGNIMVVVGGSDGKDCFSDIWCLNLGMSDMSSLSLLTDAFQIP